MESLHPKRQLVCSLLGGAVHTNVGRIEAKQMDNVSSIADGLITVLCSLLGPPSLVLIVLMVFLHSRVTEPTDLR